MNRTDTLPLKASFPGPGRLPTLQTLRRLMKDPLELLENLVAQYGDLFIFRLGPAKICVLNQPEAVEEVLVHQAGKLVKGRLLERSRRLLGQGLLTSEGELHKEQRKLITPAFHRQRLTGYAASMSAEAEELALSWRSGDLVDMSEEIRRLTLRIVARTLFSAEVDTTTQREIGAALETFQESFRRLMLPLPAGLLEWLPTPATLRFRRARARLDAIIRDLIAERRRSGDQGDMLSMLLEARDEEGRGMNEQQIRDEVLTLFLAGHETTANALAFSFLMLARHPEVADTLAAEADAVLGERSAGLGDLPHLVYCRQVLSEAMRLYPPAWAIGRRATQSVEVAGRVLEAGTIVLVSPWLLHRRAEVFADPLRFDPRRFAPGANEARHKFAYMPFGAGPRLCIGMQFAWLEGILLLATLTRKFRATLADPLAEIALQASVTLRPEGALLMRLERRRPGAIQNAA